MAGKKTNIKNTPPVSPHPDWDAVFQIIHEPAMIVSPDFNILHANIATQKAFGLSEQQLQGRNCYEIFHGTKTAPPGCPLAKLMATGRAQTNELEVEMLHGNYRVSCTPIFDENGKIKSIFHLASDITERVQTERALRHVTRLYATLSQVNQIIVRVKERDELFEAICRVAVEFGKFRMAWIGLIDDASLQLNPISHAGYEDGYLQTININVSADSAFSKGPSGQAILKGEVVTNNDIESSQPILQWRDAALKRGYRSSAAVPFRHMGVVIGTLNLYSDESGFFSEQENALLKEIGMDISFALDNIETESQRKQAQEKLKESLTILRIAEESAKLGGWSVDLKTNHVVWSNQVAAIHEMPDGFSPLIEEGIRFYAPEWREKMEKVFGDCAQNGIPYNEEMEIITASGKRVWVQTMGAAVRNDQGEIIKVQGAFQDISERKQMEDALRINQEIFSLFMRYSPIHIFIKEVTPTKSRVFQASDNFQEMVGVNGREMIGKTMEELFPAELAAKMTADDWAVVANGKVLKVDEDFNGRHYTSVKFPIVLGDKTLLAGYSMDITERVQAEEKIKKIGQHYQALIEKAPDGIVLLNEQGNFKFVSPSAKIMFGFSVSEEMTGNPVQYTHPDDLPLVLSELGRLLEDPAYIPTLQYRFSDKNGNWKWVESTFSNLLADPSVESIVINFRDITERKLAEEKLINSEVSYRRLFEAAKDGILILDAETGVVLDVNPFLLEILGSPKEDICGKELWELGFFKDIAANKSNFLELQQKEYIRYEDLPLESTRGRRLNVEFVSNVYEVDHRRVIQCNIRDITERKLTDEKLRESEQTLRNFITNSPDTIYVLDLENHTSKYLNCEEFCGYPKSTLESPTSIMFALHPDDLTIVQENWKDMLRASDGEVISCEYRLQRKDGVWEWIQQRMTILARTTEEKPSRVLVTLSIVTERKLVEEKIRQLNAELEQRVEDRTRELREAQEKLVRHEKLVVLGQMSSSVGHELRNPLSVINSAIYYLKMIQPDAGDDVKEYLGIIDQEVRTADKIITDLLDFSRIKSVDREAVSVSELIRRTLERFPVPESVAVTIDVPPDLPQVFVDVHHMTQVLGNLTVNACQAMTSSNESTLIVGQLSLYSTVQNDMINITVKDNGVGISAENMNKIFEPLFTTKTKGIGLGLAVSQKLVAANEGRIEVESEAGKGTSFHVYLPIYGVTVVARDKKESE